MRTLARRVGCTEGQLYTIVIGFVAAVALIGIGIPPVLRDEPSLVAAPGATAQPAQPPTSATTTTTAPPTGAAVTTAVPRIRPSRTAVAQDPRPSPQPSPATPGTPTPRSVIDAGYTSSTSGTPLSGPEVPEDGMPVGVRLGQVDKVSYARLAGTDPVLHLALVDDGAANHLVAFAAVRACAITEAGWTLSGPGAPHDEAPAHDPDRCVDGTAEADGTWSFEVGALGDIDAAAGIALLPVSEGPTTFQVTFSTVAET